MIRLALLAAALCLLLLGFAAHIWTKPFALSSFGQVKSDWKPSYSLLLANDGRPMGEVRADFSIRRMNWVSYSQLSPAIREVFISGEDKRFWRHNGVDWLALLNAAVDNRTAQHKRGGSTISMQLAASLRTTITHTKRKNIRQKLRQMRTAKKLEQAWSKQQIFEAWLNQIDFRGEIQGIGAASQIFAAKPAQTISKAEALALAAMVPAPNAAIATIARRACSNAKRLAEPVDCQLVQARLTELIDRSKTSSRNPLAFHVKRKLAGNAGSTIRSTLDMDLQIFAEQILARHLKQLKHRNVRDGAILVSDNRSGDILAWVGSNLPTSRAGHVDGVTAKRQAGSSLKPHLYGLAIENRVLDASSILDDSAVQLESVQGIYAPQNYDRRFVGPVSVRYALGNSLNIPAVKALKLVGIESFMERLGDLGYTGLDQSADYYGFALALGSVEVSLFEQIQAYRTLANGGRFSPISLLPSPLAQTRQVLSEPAAYITTHMMADRSARQHTFGRYSVLDLPFAAAVKTGTSKAMRDNWAVGFSSRYTVGVWVGNFEGDSMTGVSGTDGAAPIWNQLMLRLHQEQTPPPFIRPEGITQIKISFAPAIEAPRNELFLTGQQRPIIRAIGEHDKSPRIRQPVDGTVIALDPDIPTAHQLVRFVTQGTIDDQRLLLNQQEIEPEMLWHPILGRHDLRIVDANHNIIDHVSFTVR